MATHNFWSIQGYLIFCPTSWKMGFWKEKKTLIGQKKNPNRVKNLMFLFFSERPENFAKNYYETHFQPIQSLKLYHHHKPTFQTKIYLPSSPNTSEKIEKFMKLKPTNQSISMNNRKKINYPVMIIIIFKFNKFLCFFLFLFSCQKLLSPPPKYSFFSTRWLIFLYFYWIQG